MRFDGVDAEELLIELDLRGIAVSSGSACASGTHDPSHVLLALGLTPTMAHQSIRISLGRNTSEAELVYLVDSLAEVLSTIRQYS